MPLAALVLALLVLLPSPALAVAWVWPLAGPHVVSRVFAPGPTSWAPGHRGVDLPAAAGAAVLSAGDGRVSYAGLLAGRGVVVVVHGALRTTYEPVSPQVGVGQAVRAGEQLGTLDAGHEGCPAPACLHWGLRRGEDYLDPVRLVQGGPVRLLPPDDAAARAPTSEIATGSTATGVGRNATALVAAATDPRKPPEPSVPAGPADGPGDPRPPGPRVPGPGPAPTAVGALLVLGAVRLAGARRKQT